jgi:RES domain-containing protein
MDERQIEQQRIELLLANFSLKNSTVTRVEGYFYRTVNYRYSRQPLSTRGAEITGGRYNFRPPQGESLPCLYCAERLVVALALRDITASTEKFYNLKTNNAPLPPHTIVSIWVKLERVLNLSSPAYCQAAGVNWQELNQPWEYNQDILRIAAYPQRVGQLAYDREDIEGILFASTKVTNTLNLVIFPERVRSLSVVELYDPQNELE